MGKITTTFGETHHQAVLVMGKTYQVVTEKRAQVANLAENVLILHIYILKFVLSKSKVPQRN